MNFAIIFIFIQKKIFIDFFKFQDKILLHLLMSVIIPNPVRIVNPKCHPVTSKVFGDIGRTILHCLIKNIFMTSSPNLWLGKITFSCALPIRPRWQIRMKFSACPRVDYPCFHLLFWADFYPKVKEKKIFLGRKFKIWFFFSNSRQNSNNF